MALTCSTSEYIISPYISLPNYYWVWNKITKTLGLKTISSVTDFYELNEGSIIDVFESGTAPNSTVILITKGNSTEIINEIFLPSTSGDYHNVLLAASVTSGTLTIKMYSTTLNEITTLTYAMQTSISGSPPIAITPCFNDYTKAANVIINSWCDGFTLNQQITNDTGGVDLSQIVNSTSCGYAPPTPPFRVSEYKEIEYFDDCFKNPVFMVWKNTIGGWDQCLFESTQTESIDTISQGSFINDYVRIGDIDNPESEIGKSATPRTVYTRMQLTSQQKIALIQILYTNKIYILNKDGSINREIKVLPGSFLIRETKDSLHTISFEAQQPRINTLSN